MAREDARSWHEFTKMIGLFSLVTLLTFQGAVSQQVKVEPEVMSYPSQAVNLRCAFTDAGGIQLTQVSWIYEPKEGERLNIAVYHPSFGASYPTSPLKGRVSFTTNPPSLSNPSIQISDVKMTDEGKYICEYATYPSGNEQGVTSLVMLAKPRNSASGVTAIASTVAAGAKPVVVARCESVDGRPAAQIAWVTAVNGNATSASKAGVDNTVTVSSEYMLVPTAADNGKDISCVVSHRTQAKPESFLMKLTIEYPPQVTIGGYDDNWYVGRTNVALTCQATGNPIPTTLTWKTMTGQMPDTVQIKENVLTVLKVDEQTNTTFVCEVKNRLGTGKDQVTVMVREPSMVPSNAGVVAGAVIGSLLVLLLVAALIAVLVTRSRRQQQGYRSNPNHSSYDIKSRIFGSGKKGSKNGTGAGAGGNGAGGNNNSPIYVYREGSAHDGMTEKANHHVPLHLGGRGEGGVGTAPTAQDILLSSELDEAERRKFDQLEDDEESYDHFGGGGPILQLRPPHDQDGIIGGYLDDDMESQRDGSVISRTAVYV
ncbi:nectin-2-like isoform X1 [Coregonus clupeaformis]|uniref:nectin-2-like isoform X1 n=1 Tax=Coregonus clupeaformis TaxID=59861 RepID=UPI001E1C86AD|nr:nectin-2-like isoform X1 [Coregonus clupeaformis]